MPSLHRVRPRTADGEDRLSALPDDLILLILSMLDTRTALSTAVLARRWACILRELPALDFRVSDILPPEYDRSRTVALRQRNLPCETNLAKELDDLMADCEIDTMSKFVNGVTSFLEADGGHGRRVKTLRLEFFQTYDGICADRLITAAVGAWGVEDLEVVVRRRASGDDQTPAYSLPQDCLNLRSRLRSLTLGKYCTLSLLHSYGTVTKLVLRDMPAYTPVQVYETMFKDCTGLQVLHLTSCSCAHHTLSVDAPCSQIRELVLEECSFHTIQLHELPMLVRLACCLTDTARVIFGWVPCLVDTNLTFSIDGDDLVATRFVHEFDSFLLVYPIMTNLIVRFTRLRRFIAPSHSERRLPNLKRLLVADLPSNWDILWPCCLLAAAPSLEVMHIYVPRSETEPEYMWRKITCLKSDKKLRHHHLKELVLIGFRQRHIWLLKYVVSVCTSLQCVILLKDGHVRYTGLWDWQMVGKQICPWSDDEKMVLRSMIKNLVQV